MLKLESWIGLESNPEVMTQYAQELGVSSSWGFTDCFGFDAEALSYVPKPCVAAIFLYPFSLVEARKRALGAQRGAPISRVWHMKQSVANACGAVAIMHAVMNNLDHLGRSSRFLDDFKDSTRGSSAEGRGLAFAPAVRDIHFGIAARGQTDAPRPTADLDFHFLSYVEVDNRLYELEVMIEGDGNNEGPIDCGPVKDGDFLQVVIDYIRREYVTPFSDAHFSLMTLGPKQHDTVNDRAPQDESSE